MTHAHPATGPASRAVLLIVAGWLAVGCSGARAADPPAPAPAAATSPAAAPPLFVQDFTAAEAFPEQIMVLNGEFAVVAEADGNRVMSVAPTPLDTYNCLFGPSRREDVAVRARAKGAARGRQGPAFGVGLNGVSGYVLRLSVAKGAIELCRDEQVLASAPYKWKPDAWLRFHLQVRKTGEAAWMVEGKAWLDGETEPTGWLVMAAETQEPVSGKASCWAVPYSGKAILFDDLLVSALGAP